MTDVLFVCLQVNYRTSNRFSEHDNRNSFQNHGVYFGDVSINLSFFFFFFFPNCIMHVVYVVSLGLLCPL